MVKGTEGVVEQEEIGLEKQVKAMRGELKCQSEEPTITS
jgi:hypothetical protein